MVGSDSEMGACCNCDWSCFPPFLGEKEDLVNYPPLAHYNIGDGGGGGLLSLSSLEPICPDTIDCSLGV